MQNSRRQFLLSAASLLGVSSLAFGQDEATFSTSLNVVDVLATVRTKKNEIVRDLTKDDFVLTENGRPQTIRYFSKESELPLTVGLMIDTSMSQQKVLESERTASFRFLDQVLRESKDKLFVMQFDMAVQLRQPLTSSRSDLEEVLPYVDTPTRRELGMQNGGGTLLYDAIVKASNDVLKNQKNRKAMIVLSDGGENGSNASLLDAIEAAERADTLIYSILFSDSYFGGGDGRGILHAPLQRDRSVLLGSLQKARHRRNLSVDRRRTSQPVQHGLHLRPAARDLRVPHPEASDQTEGLGRPNPRALLGQSLELQLPVESHLVE